MYRYVRTQSETTCPQVLLVQDNNESFYPVFHHTTVDQDRPTGKIETFCEHTHDVYHMVLYAHSTGYYSLHGRKQNAQPGTFVIISPGQSHDFVTAWGKSKYSEITFSLESPRGNSLTLPFEQVLSRHIGATIQLVPQIQLSKDVADELHILMIQITDFLESRSLLSLYHASRCLARIFEIVVSHCCSQKEDSLHTHLDERIVQVRQYIEDHFSEPIRIDELTSMVHMSDRHLFRMFIDAFRVSPLVHQQNLRLEAAQSLLRSTPLRCNEIAARVGYPNVYYFHRIFKKKTGMTPRQYRLSRLHGMP